MSYRFGFWHTGSGDIVHVNEKSDEKMNFGFHKMTDVRPVQVYEIVKSSLHISEP